MRVLVYGSKEFAQVLAKLVRHCGHQFEGFIDDYSKGTNIVGTYAEVKKRYSPSLFGIVVGIGYKYQNERWQIYQRLLSDDFRVPSLIHKTAYVADVKGIGTGSIIMANVTTDVGSSLEELAVVWPGCIVNHDSHIGKNTFLSPGSIICGHVSVGHHCFVGAGAIIVDHRSVPDQHFIKAGALYK